MTSTVQSSSTTLSISHHSASSPILKHEQGNQRSVGTQAKIGAPLKIITPRPWQPQGSSMSSGVSATSSRPASVEDQPQPQPPKPFQPPKVLEDHSYFCPSPDNVNDDALIFDEKVVDGVKIKTKTANRNAIKFVLQKNLHNDDYKIQEMEIKDASKNAQAPTPQQALGAFKQKNRRKQKFGLPSRKASFVVPLDGQGQVPHSQDQFVNEVISDQVDVKEEVFSDVSDDEEDHEEVIYELTSEDGYRAASNDINKLWIQVSAFCQQILVNKPFYNQTSRFLRPSRMLVSCTA